MAEKIIAAGAEVHTNLLVRAADNAALPMNSAGLGQKQKKLRGEFDTIGQFEPGAMGRDVDRFAHCGHPSRDKDDGFALARRESAGTLVVHSRMKHQNCSDLAEGHFSPGSPASRGERVGAAKGQNERQSVPTLKGIG